MRITNGIINNNTKNNILVNKEYNDRYNTMVATGQKITRPSDDPIIAMSDFNKTYYQKAFGSRVSVLKILYPLQIDVSQVHEKKWCREHFGFKLSDFIVFYNFSI